MRALFLHGIEDRGASWDATRAALGEDVECHAPDLPWRMFTDFSWLREVAPHEAVRAELERTDPEVCVAHSFGALALIEALLRTRSGARPRSLVLIAPFYLSGPERLDWRLLDRTREEFGTLMRDSVLSRARLAGRSLSEQTVSELAAKLMSGISPLAFTALFGHFALLRGRPLEEVGIPGRLIGSRDDPGFAGARAAELGGRLGLRLTLLPGRDHFLHCTQPLMVADAVRSLLVKEYQA